MNTDLVGTLALLNVVDPLLNEVLTTLGDPIVTQKLQRVRKQITEACSAGSNISRQQQAFVWVNRLYAVLTVADVALRYPGAKDIVALQLVTIASQIRLQGYVTA